MSRNLKTHNFFHYLVTILVYLAKGIMGESVWLVVGVGGFFIYQKASTPYDLVIGMPLVVISVGFIVNLILSELLAVFSPKYNKEVCVICN